MDNSEQKTLGQLIIDYRARNNLTQAEFGELIGVKRLAVHCLEKSKNRPKATTESKIKKLLGIG